jgi:hypothetical protein
MYIEGLEVPMATQQSATGVFEKSDSGFASMSPPKPSLSARRGLNGAS